MFLCVKKLSKGGGEYECLIKVFMRAFVLKIRMAYLTEIKLQNKFKKQAFSNIKF